MPPPKQPADAEGTAAPPQPAGAPAAERAATTAAGAGADYGAPGALSFRDFGPMARIDPDNVRRAADLYYIGMLDRVGAYRAVAQLVENFMAGVDLGGDDLTSKVCAYIRRAPLRLSPEERHGVIRRLLADGTLERLLERLSRAMLAWELSRRPYGSGLAPALTSLSEHPARLAVVRSIEQLLLFVDDHGDGAAGLVAHEAGLELIDVLDILDERALRAAAPGEAADDVFAVIASLFTDEADRPTEWESRQMARMAASGRKILLLMATHAEDLDKGSDGDFGTLGELVDQWRAAHESTSGPVAAEPDEADDEAADEDRLHVIRLRRRAG